MPNSLSTSQRAAQELLDRRQARRDFKSWCKRIGFEPAKHHELIISLLQSITDGTCAKRKVMLLMPPGTAKTTYTSKAFVPWYLASKPGNSILACSYAYSLAERFGKWCRNTIDNNGPTLGFTLSKHSQAAGDWETSTGGIYFCAGVGAGIAGHRADLALIDDYLGSQEDADSKLVRDKQWDWYWNDFWPRLKPHAAIVIIANRRHEDDLVGRLLDAEGDEWLVIRIPYFAEDNDPLGRSPGERIWPEWFTEEQALQVKALPPRTYAGLYQQRPAPEDGDYFKAEWLVGYSRSEYDELMARGTGRVYGSGDFAVSEEKDANRTCLGGGMLETNGLLYVLPDIFWKIAGPKEVLENYLAFLDRRQPLIMWAEKGHISKALGPFLREQMYLQRIYAYIKEVTPVKAKDVRARSIQGRMAMGLVRFPTFASWWPDAEHELLTFPGGKTDDFVDFLSHLGMGLTSMARPVLEAQGPKPPEDPSWRPTLSWLKGVHERSKRKVKYCDN